MINSKHRTCRQIPHLDVHASMFGSYTARSVCWLVALPFRRRGDRNERSTGSDKAELGL